MAKSRNNAPNLTRRQIARKQKDAQQQRVLILIAVIVGIIIVAITAYGVISETAKARRPVARVGEAMITTTDFKKRQYYERWMARLQVYSYQELLNQVQTDQTTVDDGVETPIESADNAYIQQLQISISNLESQLSEDLASLFAGQVLDTMIEEELIRQEADKIGLTVDEGAIDSTIEEFLGFSTTTQTITETIPTPDPEDIKDTYNQFKSNVLEPSRLSEEDFRSMIRTSLLLEQLKSIFGESVELEEDQVQVTIFALSTEDQANNLTTRINDGSEDLDSIIAELNEDDDESSYGFSAPWLPLGYLGNQISLDIERVAFNTPTGRASEAILGPGDLFYVVFVNGHEVRPLSEDVLYQSQEQEYSDWLLEQTDEQTEYLSWQDAILTSP